MKNVFLVFPHQLFKDVSVLKNTSCVYLVEEYLFFKQYKFHQQKLVLHRSSMKFYEQYLLKQSIDVCYIDSLNHLSDISHLLHYLAAKQITHINFYDVCDNWLDKRISLACEKLDLVKREFKTPLFINDKRDLEAYFSSKEKYFQTDFYIQQRVKLGILIDDFGQPIGGKWSFDSENRKKYPGDKNPPSVVFPEVNHFYEEAIAYVQKHYADHYGSISLRYVYPCTHEQSEKWLYRFFDTRFKEFGDYEDAIVEQESLLHHSMLTPMLNIGLLLPMQIVATALEYGKQHDIPINALEGFVRQIIGWREFIRGVYLYAGTAIRNRNFWEFHNSLPAAFYSGTTGVGPVDTTILKVLSVGYNHHIERLMVLGNFMLLCEIHPDQVYQWFMEMYIDAYDWVMVPNVYAMSQFADGGLMATKPYISGSNYILKMSNYKKGDWCNIWDVLFWNFMNKHRNFFFTNPRIGMLVKTYDKMPALKKKQMDERLLQLERKWGIQISGNSEDTK